ncbi:MAG: 2-oxoglutarate ferredoxin oxidoreductase subunit alpha [Rhodothermales bacterium]|jgi:2-oxoglutarate ferredoxin oxidoreductase subunit alpha
MAQKTVESIPEATILFAGDSGDGMQLTGSQFTLATAYAMNDLATLPDFPAEIRAPVGTTYGVSGFQLHFGSINIRTPGDEVDLLVAMNPAALKVNLDRVRRGGSVLVNSNAFERRSLDLAGYEKNPLEDGSMEGYHLVKVELTKLTRAALKDWDLNQKEIDRSKNMFALGLALWLYSRPVEPAERWITNKFAKKETVRDANLHLLKKGYHYGETTEQFVSRYEVDPAKLPAGRYRAIQGVHALSMGLLAASVESGLPLFYGSYPITPASDLLHTLSRYKHFGVMTFQAEDEIAAVGSAIGAAFGGALAVTGTSGPGLALKAEAVGLAHIMELPLVIVNMQRGGPSTGLPTKTEQSDLLQAMYGRNGDSSIPIVAPSTPGDCFDAAYEAARLAVTYMTPVILLSDGYLANGSAPWLIPDVSKLPPFPVKFADKPNGKKNGKDHFNPYVRDQETMARPWATPGTKGLEHRIGGLEKEDETGNVSYDEANHERMTKQREEKVLRIARELPPLEIYGDKEGDFLLLGWGSTRGSIEASIDLIRAKGISAGAVHLRHINPLPLDLVSILGRYKEVVVPELNNGQLVRLLRDRFLLPLRSLTKIQGRPFMASEIVSFVESLIPQN